MAHSEAVAWNSDMTDGFWQETPSIPLLQWLVRGSLKQNLLQAIRLWVGLHLLYGEASRALPLPASFLYADWRNGLFTASHPTAEKQPDLHDLTCPCAKMTAAWLFHPDLSLTQSQWQADQNRAEAHEQLQQQCDQFRQALAAHNLLPSNLDQLLFQTRLFAVTRRTLYGDLRLLTSIHWLTQQGTHFRKVNQ